MIWRPMKGMTEAKICWRVMSARGDGLQPEAGGAEGWREKINLDVHDEEDAEPDGRP